MYIIYYLLCLGVMLWRTRDADDEDESDTITWFIYLFCDDSLRGLCHHVFLYWVGYVT